MSGYLLDTNVVSELRKPRPHSAVVTWVSDQPEEQLFLELGVRILQKQAN